MKLLLLLFKSILSPFSYLIIIFTSYNHKLQNEYDAQVDNTKVRQDRILSSPLYIRKLVTPPNFLNTMFTNFFPSIPSAWRLSPFD